MKAKKQKKASLVAQDWHPADIVAALRKAGWSFRRLSAHYGLAATSLNNVNKIPWPKGEKRVAEALGIQPWDIWPSRYAVSADADGTVIGVPNRGRPGRKKANDTASAKKRNAKARSNDRALV